MEKIEYKELIISYLLGYKKDHDEPFILYGKDSYSINQILDELRGDTEMGRSIETSIIKLSIDLIIRGRYLRDTMSSIVIKDRLSSFDELEIDGIRYSRDEFLEGLSEGTELGELLVNTIMDNYIYGRIHNEEEER